MTSTRSLTPAAVANAMFLFAAAAGLIIQIFTGVPGFPDIPPGPIILGAAGLLVLTMTARYRWVLILGVIAPVFIIVGALIEGSFWGRLGDPADFGPFLGTALQMLGVVVATIAGAVAVAEAYRKTAVR
jgi:hypothetical protein